MTEAIVTVILAILTWVVSGVITVTYMKTKVSDFDRRLTVAEEDFKEMKRDFLTYQVETAKDIARALARANGD